MQILLIGNGGREHAIAWKLSQSATVEHIFVAPGNGGTARLPKCENVPIKAEKVAALRDFAVEKQVDLVVVGPEAPLVAGITDLLQAAGLTIFGPSRIAAQLEGSKAFSKQFMQRHGIPTGQAEIFDDFDKAMRALRWMDLPPVVKASGLAGGKGVILPRSMEAAAETVREMLLDRRFGAAGETVLIEERLEGPELSVLVFCDGKTFRVMPPAQDHKQLLDGDRGPNTGGMGAFAPSPLATPALMDQVAETIIQPTLDGIAAEGAPYVGVLYVGLMLTADGPKVLEYNCRFGDPETQALLPLLESDLAEIFTACVQGRLAETEIRWHPGAAATVVMAAPGYPEKYPTGVAITGIEQAEAAGCVVFQAGAKLGEDGRLLTSGGRVLAVSAVGDSLDAAIETAYVGVSQVHFNEAHFRTDIGRT